MVTKIYTPVSGRLEIQFRASPMEFTKLLNMIKSIQGRTWNPDRKIWSVPDSIQNRAQLEKYGFSPLGAKEEPKEVVKWEIPPTPMAEVDRSKLHPDLHDYQVEGVGFLEARGGSGLIADSCGLGKTNQAISYLRLHPEKLPAVIVVPASVKGNWQNEIRLWAGKDSIILSGEQAYPVPRHKFVIINYNILATFHKEEIETKKGVKTVSVMDDTSWVHYLKHYNFKTIVADECHYLKNVEALRTKAFQTFVTDIPTRIFLSATPILSRPAEFFTVLNALDPVNFGSHYAFLHKYCDPQFSAFGWTYKGLTNAEELQAKIAPLMIRRRKEDVLKDLPEKQIFSVSMDMDDTSMRKYKKASDNFIKWVDSTEKKKAEDKDKHISTLRALAYQGKRNAVIEWIESFLDSGERLIVMCQHTNVIDDIAAAFKGRTLIIDGRTKGDRQKLINEKPWELLIGQLEAASVGLNMVQASNIALAESPYTPGTVEQVFGRISRLTQKASSVTLHWLIAAGTIDEDILVLLDTKQEISDTVLDRGRKTDMFGMSLDDMIVELYRGKGRK